MTITEAATEVGKSAVVNLSKTDRGMQVLQMVVMLAFVVCFIWMSDSSRSRANERESQNIDKLVAALQVNTSTSREHMATIEKRTEDTERFKMVVSQEHRAAYDLLQDIFQQNQRIIELLVEMVKGKPAET